MHLGSKLAGSRPLFLIPTTMRSQIDVSVGGACCPAFAGRWKAPLAVFSDPTLLRDLPLREYVAGLAEAVKCAIVQDADSTISSTAPRERSATATRTRSRSWSSGRRR